MSDKLIQFGFSALDPKKVGEAHYTSTFTRKDSYILISLCDVKKVRFIEGNFTKKEVNNWGISVRIGEGGFFGLEYHWSSIDLVDYLSTSVETLHFSFNKSSEIEFITEQVLNKLKSTNEKFLTNDLSDFYRKRNQMLTKKEPRTIVIEDTSTGKVTLKPNQLEKSYRVMYTRKEDS